MPCGWLLWHGSGSSSQERSWLHATAQAPNHLLGLMGAEMSAVLVHPRVSQWYRPQCRRLTLRDSEAYASWAVAAHGVMSQQANHVARKLLHAEDGSSPITFGVFSPGGELLSAASGVLTGRGCSLAWVGTRLHVRGLGLARCCVWAVVNWAACRGMTWMAVQSTSDAEPFYRSLGFERYGQVELWTL